MQANRVRNDAFFMGTAWSVFLVVLLVWFKSAPIWPLSAVLLMLAGAALGWAAVLAHALRRQRRGLQARLDAAGGASRAAVGGMAQTMIEQMQGACAELQRVDELLGHAIEQLLAAFNSVSEQAREHQGELAHAAATAQGTPGGQRLRAAAERVASEVNGAVMALQFRDVVGQKLGHVRSELAALEQAMHGIHEACAECAHLELAAKVGGLLQQMKQARAASPVRQELMHAGEVELF